MVTKSNTYFDIPIGFEGIACMVSCEFECMLFFELCYSVCRQELLTPCSSYLPHTPVRGAELVAEGQI